MKVALIYLGQTILQNQSIGRLSKPIKNEPITTTGNSYVIRKRYLKFIRMTDILNFQRGQIVGACIVGASITKTTEMCGVSRSTVSKVITAFEKEEKISSLKQNSGRKPKLSDMDRQTLMRIVTKDHKSTAPKLNDHLENPVSTKAVRWVLHKARFHGWAAIRKPLLAKTNIAKCLEWSKNL
ncbi:uncharacterized protein LOC118762572 [Octopus sinensis]|uniref:Uncharacterized protein LOC118762572 n=1 Tax=Octopus sinensis TaxID=2607531 RepID=A0A7E6ENK0_9MOLL|nr:uncharacterized protein LOC118762572 [Octopus sinensis]